MITLGGVTLPDSIVWSDRFAGSSVAQVRKRTLGGKQVISALALTAGVPITLQAGEDFGWMSKTTIEQIRALSEAVGMVYTFAFAGQSYQVVFRHDDPPAVEFQPLVPRENHASDDWFVGTIKLFTV